MAVVCFMAALLLLWHSVLARATTSNGATKTESDKTCVRHDGSSHLGNVQRWAGVANKNHKLWQSTEAGRDKRLASSLVVAVVDK